MFQEYFLQLKNFFKLESLNSCKIASFKVYKLSTSTLLVFIGLLEEPSSINNHFFRSINRLKIGCPLKHLIQHLILVIFQSLTVDKLLFLSSLSTLHIGIQRSNHLLFNEVHCIMLCCAFLCRKRLYTLTFLFLFHFDRSYQE